MKRTGTVLALYLVSQPLIAYTSAAALQTPNIGNSHLQFDSPGSITIDTFDNRSLNDLGFFHGPAGAPIGVFEAFNGTSALKVATNDIDAAFVTSLAEGCADLTPLKSHYVHVKYSGSPAFSISLQQHNRDCDEARSPFPETWDSVQAGRYTSTQGNDVYIPLAHFDIDFQRIVGLALENWYTNETTWIHRVEIVPSSAVPDGMKTITKLPSGQLHTGCANPNHIAFGIDDGSPGYLQTVLQIIKEEQIPVTFFVQGLALEYSVADGNFTHAYREMKGLGHQFGLHSMTHPHMESLQTDAEINDQITRNIDIVKKELDIETPYFRPPYGTVGARTRQALARYMNPRIIMWSIDVADWIYGGKTDGDPDRMQYKAFEQSLNKGGSIVVMHYLYQSTVDQFRDMVRLAKDKGRQFVRVDQCIGDPAAPEIWGWKRTEA